MINRCQLIVVFLLTFLGAQGYSQNILSLSDEVESVKVGKHLHYLETEEELLDEHVVSGKHDHQFKKSNKDALNFGVTTSIVWVKFTVLNKDYNTERILRVKNALLDNVRLYYQTDKGEWSMIEAGDLFEFDRRQIKDHDHCFRLDLETDKKNDFYIRFQTSGSMQLPLEIHSVQDYQKTVLINEWSFGLFTGAMFIMVLYNLFLFFGLKDSSYLAYSLFILVNLLLMNSYSGHNFKFFLGNYPTAAALSIPILMALIPFTVSLFSLSFLGPKNINIPLRVSLYAVLGISLFLVLLVFIIPLRISTSMAGLLIVLTLIVAIMAGVSSWIQGLAGAKYYVLAWVLLIASGLITAFRNFGLIDHNYFTVHSSRIATVIEVVLLSFSLAARYRRFRKEKEEAQEQVIEMQREANIVLEKKVEERTQQLKDSNDKLTLSMDQLKIEREKSENLLLNVLPEEIAEELKEKGKSAPKHFDMATVLFADIKNFTAFAEELRPDQIIEILNVMFLAFDDICRRNNLEKIKTLGDGYMAVGGLPMKNETNPTDTVRAGLEMQSWVKHWNETNNTQEKSWEIRVGINTGDVIAGVIGKHKFAYDIWGDTVNLASRMESSGKVGMVNVSENTYHFIKDKFDCVHQGKVKVKNKGKVDIYQVLKESSENYTKIKME